MGFCTLALIGYVLLISSGIPAAQYTGTFLAACGVYPMIPIMVMWNGNNIGGSTKRGVGIAMQIGFGNCGGVIASFVYRSKDVPRYFFGHGIVMGFLALSLVLIVVQYFALSAVNRRRDAENQDPALYTEEQKSVEMDKGDGASYFRYTV
jgi:hypothetical protein